MTCPRLWLAATLLATGCTTQATTPQLVREGRLIEACRVQDRCARSEPCPDADTLNASSVLARALSRRAGMTMQARELTRDEVTERVRFEVAADHSQRSLTLGVRIAASESNVAAAVHDVSVEGLPQLSWGGDEDHERYVLALGGPRRPPRVPHDAPRGLLGGLLAVLATMGMSVVLDELGNAPPVVMGSDGKGRKFDHHGWAELDQVRAARSTQEPRWHLYDNETVAVPPGGSIDVTRGFTFTPWRDAAVFPEQLGYRFLFAVPTDGPTAAVAVSPAGWIGVVSGLSSLRVLHGQDGHLLASAKICDAVDDGLFLTAKERGVVVCRDRVAELHFPAIELGRSAPLPFDATQAASSGGVLAVAGGRSVRVLSLDSLETLDDIVADSEVTALAVAPDGERVAIGDSAGDTRIVTIASGGDIVHRHGDGGVEALAFSPDGRSLATGDGQFSLHSIDTATGAGPAQEGNAGSWLKAMRYLSPDLLAAVGSDGLVLYPSSLWGVQLIDPFIVRFSGANGLGASADGRLVCSGDPHGRVACYAQGEPPATEVFAAWQRREQPAVVLRTEFTLTDDEGKCTYPAIFQFHLPEGLPPREALATLSARGPISLAEADRISSW